MEGVLTQRKKIKSCVSFEENGHNNPLNSNKPFSIKDMNSLSLFLTDKERWKVNYFNVSVNYFKLLITYLEWHFVMGRPAHY